MTRGKGSEGYYNPHLPNHRYWNRYLSLRDRGGTTMESVLGKGRGRDSEVDEGNHVAWVSGRRRKKRYVSCVVFIFAECQMWDIKVCKKGTNSKWKSKGWSTFFLISFHCPMAFYPRMEIEWADDTQSGGLEAEVVGFKELQYTSPSGKSAYENGLKKKTVSWSLFARFNLHSTTARLSRPPNLPPFTATQKSLS